MRTYHGWIYREREPGYRDRFYVEYKDEKTGERMTRRFSISPGAAVEFFDERVGKPVKLEVTPIGLRVYTEEKEDKTA